jgi:hypothetical protein
MAFMRFCTPPLAANRRAEDAHERTEPRADSSLVGDAAHLVGDELRGLAAAACWLML